MKKYLAYHQFTIMTNLCLILKRNVISFHFSAYHIRDIIKNLHPNKAHGHDKISIRMLKLCGYSIWKPLEITFINYLKEDVFPDKWKKAYSMLYPDADARRGRSPRASEQLALSATNTTTTTTTTTTIQYHR